MRRIQRWVGILSVVLAALAGGTSRAEDGPTPAAVQAAVEYLYPPMLEYMKNKNFVEAEKILGICMGLQPKDAVHVYNLACIHAQAGRTEQALTTLERSIDMGYIDFAHMQQDGDLVPLRGEARFADMLAKGMAAQLKLRNNPPPPPPASSVFAVGEKVQVEWGGTWYGAQIVETGDGKYKIRFDGYSNTFDEWVGPQRMRKAAGVVTPRPRPTPKDEAIDSEPPVTSAPPSRPNVSAPPPPSETARRGPDPALETGMAKPLSETEKSIVAGRPGTNAGLDGLYMRVVSMFTNGSLNISQEYYYFWPDGRVYDGVPEGDVNAFNAALTLAKSPKKVGVYTINGGAITIEWGGDRAAQTLAFAREGEGYKIGEHFHSRLATFKDDARFDGTYNAGARDGSTVSPEGTLVFKSNGEFSLGEQAGTYRIRGNTLELTMKNGKTVRYSAFIPFGTDGLTTAPSHIYMNGGVYTKGN